MYCDAWLWLTESEISVVAMWTVKIPKHNVRCTFGRPITIAACISRQENRAEYPPILDLKPEANTLRQELTNHAKIRNLNTIEEKTIGVNMPRFDFITFMLYCDVYIPCIKI